MIFSYNNLQIYYEDYGTPKKQIPVLFLHGWEGSHLSFKYFADKLSHTHRCINIDFPPFGNSSSLVMPFSVENYASLIIELLNFLKIEKVDIVAHSFGGRVAIELASKGQIVNRLLLTGCAGLRKVSVRRTLRIVRYKILKLLSKLKLYKKQKLLSFGSEEYKKLNDVMKQTYKNIVNYNQKKLLRQIKVPTLLVWGSIDKETPFYFTKTFKKYIKDCEVIKFENCSHFAYLQKPKLFLSILYSYFS